MKSNSTIKIYMAKLIPWHDDSLIGNVSNPFFTLDYIHVLQIVTTCTSVILNAYIALFTISFVNIPCKGICGSNPKLSLKVHEAPATTLKKLEVRPIILAAWKTFPTYVKIPKVTLPYFVSNWPHRLVFCREQANKLTL